MLLQGWKRYHCSFWPRASIFVSVGNEYVLPHLGTKWSSLQRREELTQGEESWGKCELVVSLTEVGGTENTLYCKGLRHFVYSSMTLFNQKAKLCSMHQIYLSSYAFYFPITCFHLLKIHAKTDKYNKQNMGEKGTLLYCWLECGRVQPLWKSIARVLRKLKVDLLYDPATPLAGLCLKEMKYAYNKVTCNLYL